MPVGAPPRNRRAILMNAKNQHQPQITRLMENRNYTVELLGASKTGALFRAALLPFQGTYAPEEGWKSSTSTKTE
jgi:hypothetical protein